VNKHIFAPISVTA